jgi:hypothetical protein
MARDRVRSEHRDRARSVGTRARSWPSRCLAKRRTKRRRRSRLTRLDTLAAHWAIGITVIAHIFHVCCHLLVDSPSFIRVASFPLALGLIFSRFTVFAGGVISHPWIGRGGRRTTGSKLFSWPPSLPFSYPMLGSGGSMPGVFGQAPEHGKLLHAAQPSGVGESRGNIQGGIGYLLLSELLLEIDLARVSPHRFQQ